MLQARITIFIKMKLDFIQTYLEINDNIMKMTMKPSVDSLETKQAFIQRNVSVEMFDKLCFHAEIDIVRKWVVDSGFSLDTHAYDFQKKEIIELKTTPIVDVPELSNDSIVENIPITESTKI